MILVLDYGMSNLRSVSKAIEKLGCPVHISSSPSELTKASKLILPGVGAFGDAMNELRQRGLLLPLKDFVNSGRPFLGICLGLQLLFDSSQENPETKGLGFIPGEVVRFKNKPGLKIPHMGWNQLAIKHVENPLLRGVEPNSFVYFVHSYHVVPKDPNVILAESDHGDPFVAVVGQKNIYGTQFHPEKSQETGLQILKNFIIL